MPSQLYDVIVVGGGAVGLGATYEVAKSGKSVLVLEQNCFFNGAGSSNDLARMYRTMYTEKFMAKLAHKSLKMWKDLEKDAGTTLRSMTGLLNFGDPTMGNDTPEGSLNGPICNLKDLDMPFRQMKKHEIEDEYPFKNLPDGFEGVYAPDNGVINVPLLLRTLSRLAKDYGAHARQYVKVKKLVPSKTQDSSENIWTVQALEDEKQVEYRARKVIITMGAYTNHVTEPSFGMRLKLEIWEMVSSYFNINAGPNGTVFPSMWFQFQKNKKLENGKERSQLFYGFPALEWGPPNICRIAVDAASHIITDPDHRSAHVISPADLADTQEFVKNHVVGVDSTVPAYSSSCLMTNVFDNMFVLDYVPEEYLQGGAKNSVVLFTAGWAMKFVPLLGRALKDMALDGHSDLALDEFKIDRMQKTKDGKIQKGIIDDGPKKEMGAKNGVMSIRSLGNLTDVENTEQAKGSSVHHVQSVKA